MGRAANLAEELAALSDTGMQESTVWTLPARWYADPEIYEAERRRIFAREWLWIGDPLDVCNVLKDRDLQTFIGHPEFDVSASNPFLRPSHNRRLTRRFEV